MKTYPTISNAASPTTRSWPEAYRRFLMSPKELLLVKLLPLMIVGIIPVSLADDLLLPFIGIADDVPTSLFIVFALYKTWRRVSAYR